MSLFLMSLFLELVCCMMGLFLNFVSCIMNNDPDFRTLLALWWACFSNFVSFMMSLFFELCYLCDEPVFRTLLALWWVCFSNLFAVWWALFYNTFCKKCVHLPRSCPFYILLRFFFVFCLIFLLKTCCQGFDIFELKKS